MAQEQTLLRYTLQLVVVSELVACIDARTVSQDHQKLEHFIHVIRNQWLDLHRALGNLLSKLSPPTAHTVQSL